MKEFVVEWSDDDFTILRVWTWDQWMTQPINSRNWRSAHCYARDEIDAYLKAQRGELD